MFSSELFSFEGRASRSKFWLVFLLSIFVSFVVVLFTLLATPALMIMGYFSPTVASVVSILLYLLMIPMWWISIATSVKRFHDRNKSGWWYLIVLIPLLGALWLIIENGFLKGTVGSNNFGNDPLLSSAPSSPTTATPQFAGATSFAAPQPTGTSAGMLIVYIVAGIVFVALLGRLGWAFYQVKSDEKQGSIENNYATMVEPGAGSPVVDAAPNRESGTIGSPAPTTDTTKTSESKATTPASVVSTAPTATLTVEGVTNLTVKYTGWYKYEWSSTNANNFSSTESLTGCADSSVNSPERSSLVGQGSSGSISIPITPKHTGCTITYIFTVKKAETGQKATAKVVVIVE